MKSYLPYCMIGLCLSVAWSYYPESPWLVGVNLFAAALWSHSAWMDAETRRIQKEIDRLRAEIDRREGGL